MACGVCARSTRPAASLPGEGSTHLRGCGMTAVGTDAKCAMSAIWSLSAEKRTSRTSRLCRCGGHTRRAAARGGVAGAVEKLGEPPRFRAVAASHTIRGRFYCVRYLYATIRATMLAKISSAERDFRIIGLVEWRAADGAG
jgi:hypothetical protein